MLHLAWEDNSDNEDGFEIERAAPGESFSRIVTVSANTTTYTDADLPTGQTYTYRIRAFNSHGFSSYSNVATGTTPDWQPVSNAPVVPVTDHPTLFQSDIGTRTIPGSTFYDPQRDTFVSYASDHDIWGNSDRFHFVRMTADGDVDVRVLVREFAATNIWAKAGLMIRASDAPDSPHASVFVTGGAGITLQWRSTQGGDSAGSALVPDLAPAWLRLVRVGDTIAAYISSDQSSWTLVDSIRLELPGEVLVGMALASHEEEFPTTATFTRFALDETTAQPQTDFAIVNSTDGNPPLLDFDLGSPLASGGLHHDPAIGVFTLEGGGIDIWDTADQFHCGVVPVHSNARLTVHVLDLIATEGWAKAGLMFRQSADAASPYVAVFATPQHGVCLQVRENIGGMTSSMKLSPFAGEGWLRLVRAGHEFTASHSLDGVHWTAMASTKARMPACVLAGLAATGHSHTTTATAHFRDLEVASLPPISPLLLTDGPPLFGQPVGAPQATGEVYFQPAFELGPPEFSDAPADNEQGSITPFIEPATYFVAAKGLDIWGTSDEFYFTHAVARGPFELTVRVAGVIPTNPWSKAGLMARDSLTGSARHVSVFLTPDFGAVIQGRSVDDSESFSSAPGPSLMHQWLRLRRIGDTFSALQSDDQVEWQLIGEVQMPLSPALFVGLAATSHDAENETWAVFEELSIRDQVSP